MIKMDKNCRIKKKSEKGKKKMSELLETLKIAPTYNQETGAVTLTSKEFNRILEFVDLKDMEIERKTDEVKQGKDLANAFKKRMNELYQFILSSFREKVENILSQENNKEQVQKEINTFFSDFNKAEKVMAPYYESYSDESDSVRLKRILEGYPILSLLSNAPETQLLTAADVVDTFKDLSILNEEQVQNLNLIARDLVLIKWAQKLFKNN